MKGAACSTPMTKKLINALLQAGCTLSAAESVTGGLIADAFIRQPGASRVFTGSAVVYTDEGKQRVLGVSGQTISSHTAVSAACARQMAKGARELYQTDYALASTGFAGPDGQDVGLCYLALASPGGLEIKRIHANGNRNSIRRFAALVALNMLHHELKGK